MKNFKFKKPENDAQKAVQAFLNGKDERYGKYLCKDKKLIYQCIVTKEINLWRECYESERRNVVLNQFLDAAKKGIIVLLNLSIEELENRISRDDNSYDIRYKSLKFNIIAKRLPNGEFIGNSSVLPLIGRKVAYGNEKLNGKETPVQKYLSEFVPMLPFNVFEESMLDLESMTILERGHAQNVTRIRPNGFDRKGKEKFKEEKVHFTGASLFKVENKTFLFDIDRREIAHKIFNPFLVELTKHAETIKDAYQSLMPDEVQDAMRNKLDVKRQGEWFFIPVNIKSLNGKKIFGLDADPSKKVWQRETLKLQAGNNSPNHAQIGFTDETGSFVKGKIEHSGREHADLILDGWYKAVPNTATKSFTITGDVD